ncbi:MAG TPA: nodulation protein NfeD [Burkholderiales bacterium]|nr:nodulation protein NfeD [Burkholderiales bacterium]
MDLLLLHRAAFYLLLSIIWGLAAGIEPAQPAPVLVVPLDGAVGPASADFVSRAIKRAAKDKAQLVIVRMDTPGGLDTSMRSLIKDILASPVPVATFVAPSGSRAASAGTFILYASHIAAMAPGTNLGAASPVAIGGPPQQKDDKKGKQIEDTMTRKVTNDAVAYIRGLAEMRGRNADWAEKAVRESVSLSAKEALKLKVIEHIAADVPELLKKLGKADAPVVEVEVDWRTKVLGVITNPAIAYIMIIVGIYALIFEFMNPGLVLPGVVGAICLLLALYAFHLLPVNYAGLALILLGIAFMIAEAFLPAFGSLGVGGLIAFVIGSVILLEDTDLPGFEIPYGLIAGVTAASAAFLFFVIGVAVRNRKRPVVTGREYLIGAPAEALEDFDAEGWARVQGETWRVRSGAPVRRGQRLRVKSIDGLVLTVEAEA